MTVPFAQMTVLEVLPLLLFALLRLKSFEYSMTLTEKRQPLGHVLSCHRVALFLPASRPPNISFTINRRLF
jgi:hypothetical protein